MAVARGSGPGGVHQAPSDVVRLAQAVEERDGVQKALCRLGVLTARLEDSTVSQPEEPVRDGQDVVVNVRPQRLGVAGSRTGGRTEGAS